MGHLHKRNKMIGGKHRVVCVDETHFTKRKRNVAGFAEKVIRVDQRNADSEKLHSKEP